MQSMSTNKKERIYLRKRLMPSGNTSLYLDMFTKYGRKYEYLKLYLIPEHNRADKEKNKETMQFAEAVRAKRIVELQNNEYGFKSPCKAQTLFYDYYVSLMEERKKEDSMANLGIWKSCLNHIERYDGNIRKRTFDQITPAWVQGFKNYLDNDAENCRNRNGERKNHMPLSSNSKWVYFTKFRTCINQALKDEIIDKNPVANIDSFKKEEPNRKYLTIDELKRLSQTEYNPKVKNAFLFSCLTGLRYCDIAKLTWGEIQRQGGFCRIIFRQKKTKGLEYLDISEQAAEIIGERGNPDERIFAKLPDDGNCNKLLEKWAEKAGIDKKITFHSGRHTFAVMMLDLGTDIYTVSKLLGHRDISTTQVYAKVLDKNKQKAIQQIPKIF